MAVQLSAYLWLRNCELIPLIEGKITYPTLSDRDKKSLKEILDEIDKLHSDSYFENANKPFVGPNVILPNYVRLIETTSNLERSVELFESIHKIMQNYWVNPRVYRELGRAFEEIGAMPEGDIARAIEHGTHLFDLSSRTHRHDKKIFWRKDKDYYNKPAV